MSSGPVKRLEAIFKDNLGQDWDLLPDAESALLGVPAGTVAGLLAEIQALDLWPDFFSAAANRSDQWILDMSDFVPKEERFVPALFAMFESVRTEHAKICFAQEAPNWPWGPSTLHLLPKVKDEVLRIQDRLSSTFEVCRPSLELSLTRLEEMMANAPFHTDASRRSI